MAAKESQILRATKNNLESIQREAQSLKIDELNFIARRKLRRKIKRQKRLSRSLGGDIALFTVLFAFGLFSAYPLVFTISNAFKPLDEIFIFPPKLFPRSFTFDNFIDLFNADEFKTAELCYIFKLGRDVSGYNSVMLCDAVR